MYMFTAYTYVYYDEAYTNLGIYGDKRKENSPIVFEFYKHL